MKTTDIKDIFLSPENYEEVRIEGWIRTIRDSKNFGFIELNDGTFLKNVQVVFENNLSNFEEIKNFQRQCHYGKRKHTLTPEASSL